MQQHNPELPRDAHLVLLLLIILAIFAVITLLANITQNQKGQEVYVFFREEERDYGVNRDERRKWTPGWTFLYIHKKNVEKRGTCIYVCLRACVLLKQCSVLLSSSAAIYLTPPS